MAAPTGLSAMRRKWPSNKSPFWRLAEAIVPFEKKAAVEVLFLLNVIQDGLLRLARTKRPSGVISVGGSSAPLSLG